MKKIKIIRASLLAFFTMTLCGCNEADIVKSPLYSAEPGIYHGAPNYRGVDISIKTGDLFINAPALTAHRLTYATWSRQTETPYSYYTVTCDRITHNLTRYSTTERFCDGSVITGKGITYGGIFPIMYENYGAKPRYGSFYYKYRLTNISNRQGAFFQPHVGNEFYFDYLDQVKASLNYPGLQADDENDGIMHYRVVGLMHGYHFMNATVPGNIYIIDVYKSFGPFGNLKPLYQFYFSTKLGWYVRAEYYAKGKFLGLYRLINYR